MRPPAFAREQLAIREDGRIEFTLPKKSIKGETELKLTPYVFLDKVAQLISRPGKHRHRYHGVLAPNSPMCSQVVRNANKPLSTPLTKVEKVKKRVKKSAVCVKIK